jgi:hypothetical protein
MVRDRVSGKSAAKRLPLSLPVAGSDFYATDAVLSRHAETVRPKAGNVDVLSEGNVHIRPSSSREFHSTDNLIIFFKLYNAAVARETGKPLVRITVTLMKGGQRVTRPVDYQLTEESNAPVPSLTFAKYIKLAGLAPGRYTAVIESRDISQQKVLRQDAWFVIVP